MNGHKPAIQKRKINFGPGPAQLPLEVLEIVHSEFFDYGNSGSNVMELSHRSTGFSKIINDTEQDIRDLLSIPETYAVLFLQGGATGQFSAIAMNLMNLKPSQTADYLVTGYWSEKAAKEAEKYGKVNYVIPNKDIYHDVPEQETWNLTDDASYFYYCANETIHGIELPAEPPVLKNKATIVCDMSSNFLTKEIDVSKYGLIFASAQKNFGCSGLVIVIIRKDLIGHAMKSTPINFDYKIQMNNNSMYNTPPTFSIYITNKMFEWSKRQDGGIKGLKQQTKTKSNLIYTIIDQSNGFYLCEIEPRYRSRVNIPFRICDANGVPDEKLEKLFLDESAKANMIELKGHRAVGGLRVSLYNGITVEETEKLLELMKNFQETHSKKSPIIIKE